MCELTNAPKTMKELLKTIGKTGTINRDGLKISVKVEDVKTSYGRNRYLITPVAGSGETWVEDIIINEK